MGADTIGRWLVLIGIAIAIIGGLVMALGRIVDLGNLPGDFTWEGDNTRVYVPLGTMIVLSLVLTLLLNLILRLFR